MKRRRFTGRKLIFWSSALLILWAGYEFWVRFDAISWALKGIVNLCVHEGIPFDRALSYFEPDMFYVMAYLLGMVVLGIVGLILRNRPMAAYFLIPACAGVGFYGKEKFQAFGLDAFHWMQWVKLIPLIVMTAGCIVNLVQYYMAKHKRHAENRQPPYTAAQ